MNKKIELGVSGERVAEQFFLSKEFVLVERNFRASFGEIDLIFRKEGLFVFVEVKTRTFASEFMAFTSIGREKKRRIWRTIRYFLASSPLASMADELRFDIVFVTQERVATHIEGDLLF